MKKIGVLTGGGDCPGLNPAIKAVVNEAHQLEYSVLGVKKGWKGLIENKIEKNYIQCLTPNDVRTLDRLGGTILGTSRTNPFKSEGTEKRLIRNIKRLGLDAIVAIGGEDTLGVAARLYKKYNFPIVGIPKTIDRDLSETDYTLGFDSAVKKIMEEIECIRTTAESHERIFVVETMGRHAGHLALVGGLVGGADMILIPEHDFNIEKVNSLLKMDKRAGKRYSIVVVSEGAKPKNAHEVLLDKDVDEFGHVRLGGVGDYLAKEIEKGTGLETRCVVLSHLQRGGAPSEKDRAMGLYFGAAAVEAIYYQKYGRMVSVRDSKIALVDLEDAVKKLQLVDVERDYDTNNYNVKKRPRIGRYVYL